VKHFAVGAEDDNLDTDVGAKSNWQYGIVVQRLNIGDALIEVDSGRYVRWRQPSSEHHVANFVF
jgi:hypothetical protein